MMSAGAGGERGDRGENRREQGRCQEQAGGDEVRHGRYGRRPQRRRRISTNVVVVEVPSTAPAEVAIAVGQQGGLDAGKHPILIQHIRLGGNADQRTQGYRRYLQTGTRRSRRIKLNSDADRAEVHVEALAEILSGPSSLVKSVMPNAGNRE